MASPTHLDSASKTDQSKKLTTIEIVGGIHCHICQSTFQNKKDYDTHYVKHEVNKAAIVYTCVVCNQSISGYPSFRGHCYTKHVIKSKFKCDHCHKEFSKFIALKEHINTQHNFNCRSCNKNFNSKKEWQIHQIVHNTDNPPYNCQSCNKQINSVDSCEDHISLHSSFIYMCPICGKNETKKHEAVIHLRQHFKDEEINENSLNVEEIPPDDIIENLGGISCCICFTVHKNRLAFDAHFSLKHGELDIVYTCNKCEKQCEKYSIFANHCYYHYMKNRFKCDHCLKTFARPSLLAVHTEAYHGARAHEPTEKPFACARCDRRFATQRAMRTHLREQHDITCVPCPHGCDDIFQTPKELTLHLLSHDESQMRCRVCGLLFTTLSSCEKHLEAHRKTIHKCPICNKNYGEKHMVRKHISKHFETVIHICKVCGKIYNAKNRLVEHSKTHAEVKEHTCSRCGKGFSGRQHLQQHMNTHAGLKPYKCDACPKTFASYPNWMKHMQRIHNIKGKLKKVNEAPLESNSENSTDVSGAQASPINTITSETSDTNIDAEAETNKSVSDDSTMESDSIDPVVIENDMQIFEAADMCTDVLAESTSLFTPESIDECLVTESSSTGDYPREYGPEFNSGLEGDGFGFIDLEERDLPHIDPRLTVRLAHQPHQPHHAAYVPAHHHTYTPEYVPVYVPEYAPTHDTNVHTDANYEPTKWEPLITKVYNEYAYGDNLLSLMNTDIY
ncbi:Zinc finger protein 26 [Papilio machaon]|uniref:Zinc finger protein 26 n=1 Tax=Papilio machaon TaxID=76193 RepID=A0A0N1IP86_PAPMA|nr:Zinc finger protein 26 [Papilio machaon]